MKSPIFRLLVTLVCISPILSESASAELAPWVLRPGEQRFWRLDRLERFSLSGDAVRGKSLPGGLLLKAMHPGKAALAVVSEGAPLLERAVVVLKSDSESQKQPHRLEQALSVLETTEVISYPRSSTGGILGDGRGFVLRGEITSPAEARRIAHLVAEYPDQLANETLPSEELLLETERDATAWIGSDSKLAHELWIERLGQSLWLRGHLSQKDLAREVLRQAKSQWPLLHLDVTQDREQTRTVSFRVYLLEIKRQALSQLGLSWPAESSHAVLLSGARGAVRVSDRMGFDLSLKHLESKGAARVLSEPELVVRAPGEAELFSGGQIPIRSTSQFFSEVSWKNHGLSLKIKVGRIVGKSTRLTLMAETSQLTLRETDETIPSLASNRMKTEVDARFGEHLLISGLLKQSTQDRTRGLPFLRQIPLFGDLLAPLFGSEEVQSEQIELVAVLLPSLTLTSSPETRITHHVPMGRVPFSSLSARSLTLSQEAELREHPDFPWVAFR